MQENILVLKRGELLVLAEPGAEGLDCCQAAALRGFPDPCPALSALSASHPDKIIQKHHTLAVHRDSSTGEAAQATVLCCLCCPGAHKTRPEPSLLGSWGWQGSQQH